MQMTWNYPTINLTCSPVEWPTGNQTRWYDIVTGWLVTCPPYRLAADRTFQLIWLPWLTVENTWVVNHFSSSAVDSVDDIRRWNNNQPDGMTVEFSTSRNSSWHDGMTTLQLVVISSWILIFMAVCPVQLKLVPCCAAQLWQISEWYCGSLLPQTWHSVHFCLCQWVSNQPAASWSYQSFPRHHESACSLPAVTSATSQGGCL